MYRFQHILSELNLDDADEAVVQYTSLLTHFTRSTELYFSHVQDHLHAREELPMDDDVLLPTQVDVARERLVKVIKRNFDAYRGTKCELLIKEGHQLKFLLGQIKEHEIDLVIVGREPHSPVSRKLPIKLARKAPCSVLIVPECVKADIGSIIVPIDFSHYAKDAVEEAVNLAVTAKLESITLLHLFKLPSGYSKNSKSEDEFCDLMRKNALEEYEFFKKDIDFRGIEVDLHIGHDEHLAHGILDEVKTQQADIVIVGARGRDAGAGDLMGSITEDLIAMSPVPVLAVKDKGRGMSFFESLIKL
jgi:nucleotide-binding universal stress UspA family protein